MENTTTPPLSSSIASSSDSSPSSNFTPSLISSVDLKRPLKLQEEGGIADELEDSWFAHKPNADHAPCSYDHNSTRLRSRSGSRGSVHPPQSSSCSPVRSRSGSHGSLRGLRPPSSHASHFGTSGCSRAPIRAHLSEERTRAFTRYRPDRYRYGAPIEVRFAARTTRPSSHLYMSLEDVQEGKALLQVALSCLPNELVKMAYEAKRADRDSVVQQVAQTASEIEALEKHRQFLQALISHQNDQLTTEESLLETVKEALSPRSMHDLEDDSGFYHAVFAEELVSLTVADDQLGQFEVEDQTSQSDDGGVPV